MGRHALQRTRPRRHLFALGYFFASSLVMVTIVDPYSGTMASADAVNTFDAPGEYQTLTIKPVADGDFARADFEVVSGQRARGVTVRIAPYPEPGTPKAFALQEVTSRNWDYNQFSCLVKLWERESNWRWNATNRSSGAYGIPQSLPASKMASAGADWRTNPETQILWGLGYIDGRYGSPCAALVHSDVHNWY
ncbi:unannotated protein [freshwater metagenome]|uniref:Unannotated protein n=1 Tax=freshwater metagenome TaxID=449393 RepID=A0A6J6BQA2_9ZZZZ